MSEAETSADIRFTYAFIATANESFNRKNSVFGVRDSLTLGDEEGDLSALAEGLPTTADLLDAEDDAPMILLINRVIAEAVKLKASDIHV